MSKDSPRFKRCRIDLCSRVGDDEAIICGAKTWDCAGETREEFWQVRSEGSFYHGVFGGCLPFVNLARDDAQKLLDHMSASKFMS